VKLFALGALATGALFVSWRATQHTAAMFRHSPALGRSLFGFYPPWAWLFWWSRWRTVDRFQPVWEISGKDTTYPLLVLTAIAVGAIAIARHMLTASDSDLHGSARWATDSDIRAAGLTPPRQRLPRWLPFVTRFTRVRRKRIGIYLGKWQGSYLKDCGPGHVLVVAPTRSGKGVGIVIPTLLTWPHSALIHDLKGENWELTAGARKRMGQLCLKFDPTCTDGSSVKYNPLQEVRLRTEHEAEDVQNIVHMIVDPDGHGLNDHWVKTGAALLTGAIIHLLYVEPNKTLRGLVGLLSDPRFELQDTLKRMLKAEHDPGGAMKWLDGHGIPTKTHPLVAETMREVLSKSDNERSGVVSTAMSFLSLYRDPIVAKNTQYSEFTINDLVNHERPVSLFLVVPMASRDRLRPLMRLMLNQIVRTLTTRLSYKDGRPVSANRHRLLLMLDEFPVLGRLEVLAEALSLIAGYGIRACLVAQDLTQIDAAYGHSETVTINCDTTVAFAPNKIETAGEYSRLAGETSVKYEQRSSSHHGWMGGVSNSLSTPETHRALITPDEVRRLPANEILIFTRGHPAIRANRLEYHMLPAFQRRAAIKAPKTSDRIVVPADKDQQSDNMELQLLKLT
jgi:type IV secretion system protein VirD4